MPTYTRASLQQDPAAIYPVPLVDVRVWDALATNLPATSGTDDLGLYGGTFASASPKISTGDFKNTSVTRYARFEYQLPAEYDAGQTVTLRLNAGMETTAASTSCAVDVECYKSDRAGGIGSDICATAAATFAADDTWYNKDFSITATGLAAGDKLLLKVTAVIVDSEAGGGTLRLNIENPVVLCDVKG
jgi:hypothetical protein